MSGTYLFPITFDHLRDFLLFKFIVLCHIYVGYFSINFCERLSFNPFFCTLVHFTIVFFTCYGFTSHSIVLPMSISARDFDLVVFVLGVIFMSLLQLHIKVLA